MPAESTNAVGAEAARIAEVKDVVCETLELDPGEVTETSLFREEHGADSLGAIEVLSALERRYEVVIDQSEMERMVNVRGVYDVLAEAAQWV